MKFKGLINYMADHCDFTMKNFRTQLLLAISKVRSSTCKKLIAKVARQEEKYWAEEIQLYEEIDEDDQRICC